MVSGQTADFALLAPALVLHFANDTASTRESYGHALYPGGLSQPPGLSIVVFAFNPRHRALVDNYGEMQMNRDDITSFSVQLIVINALILREIQTRFGTSNIGYLWAIIEPLFVLAIFYIMYDLLGRIPPGGMELIPFLATGVTSFYGFQNTIKRLEKAVDANRGLLLYPQVTPLDVMIARGILESATFLVVFWVIIFGSWIFDLTPPIEKPLFLIFILIDLQILAFGLGCIFCILFMIFPILDRLMSPVWRILMFLSAVFYTMDELPEMSQDWIALNPLAHAVDLLRGAYFASYTPEVASLSYLLEWTCGSLFVGLMLERMFRHRKENS